MLRANILVNPTFLNFLPFLKCIIEQLTKELKDIKESGGDDKSEQPTSGIDTSKLKSQVNLLKKRNDLLEKQKIESGSDAQIDIDTKSQQIIQKIIHKIIRKVLSLFPIKTSSHLLQI